MKRRPRKSTLLHASHPENKTRQLLAAFPLPEQRIIRMRFGIDSEVFPVKEIVQLLRLSEAEVHAVVDKFLRGFRQTGST
jgi:hypothetical protein